ncbi:MAG: bifunctional phosphoglucose/phosphomannose isomerase [Candidatus Pacebacteria bacterium]|nr:bifunctional phosphoglucose/phosphomannose isomerase [Candidatus Paceibacterota bacterium]
MREIILNFPKQFRVGIKTGKTIKLKIRPQKICICGIGGSALPANLLSMIIGEYKLNIPLIIQRDYLLPASVNKKTLLICISYSGNTEETISCLKEGLKRNLKIVLISSDGKLENFAKKYNLPIAFVPKGYPPRMALGYLFGALVGILNNLNLVPNSLIKNLRNLDKKLNPPKLEKEGKILAKKLQGKIPLIYASNRFKYLARIWKIKFNENTKIPAFWNYFPELNHNEMTGFENISNLKSQISNLIYLIILQDRSDHQRNKKRMELTLKVLKKRGIKGEIIKLTGKTFLEKLFNSIILSDWVSFYLAKYYGIDPIPVKMVEEFKKLMKE